MKTKTLLLAVFACLFSLTLFSQENGTIIYTDFEPDSIISPIKWDSSGGNPIDINFDGEDDFVFETTFSSSNLHKQIRVYTNWKLAMTGESNPKPISEYSHWENWHDMSTSTTNYFYIAFRHYIDMEFCYGWIRYEYYGDKIVINDMAYCTIPNYPLRFGQKSLTEDVAEISAADYYSLYPNPTDNIITLKTSAEHECEMVEVFSIDGRLIKSQTNDFSNINVDDINSGIYFVRIRFRNGETFTEKVVIK